MNKAVFLDRDGTINEDIGYVHLPEQLFFLPKAAEAIKLIKEKGYLAIVITNQSGVARGLFGIREVEAFHLNMNKRLLEFSTEIDAFYYCPHLPGGSIREYAIECECRKPGLLMFKKAVSECAIDTRNSYAVGDNMRDIIPGNALGMKTALISNKAGLPNDIPRYDCLYSFAASL